MRQTATFDAFPPVVQLLRPRAADIGTAAQQAKRGAQAGFVVPDYVVDVSRPVVPWRWTSVLLTAVELLAVAWSIPVIILAVGSPIILAVALIYWIGRFVLNYF